MKTSLRRLAALALGTAMTGTALSAVAAAPAVAAEIPSALYDDSDCPKRSELPADADLGVWQCNVSVIQGGTLKIGSIEQKITKPIKLTWANGFDLETLEDQFIWGPMRAEAIQVDGGVLGIPGSDFLPLLQIHAKPELAADPAVFPDDSTALRLKLKLKVQNPLLGDKCSIGSDQQPLTINLTYLTTNPPPPNKPITGQGPAPTEEDPSVLLSTPVDNAFAAPKSSDCGPWGLLNPIADFRAGLPAKAGTNTAVFPTYLRWTYYTDLP
ncbi:hypothetical protein [Actinomadura flavalba]|uniref:hypothetical protein n=1 Tax=Actinomadura flavalba TaxID=1120938 RepID=UPI0003718204|nr:hypothetical protein [Actinomadura flavalba]